MITLISILVFGAILAFILGIFYHAEYRQGRWKLIKRVKEQLGEEIRIEKNAGGSSFKNEILGMIGSLGKKVKPKDEEGLSHLRKSLSRAGYRRENAPVIFFGVKALLAIVFALGFFFLKVFSLITMTSLQSMLFFVMFALIGFYLPHLWLKWKIARRREEIIKGFPEALDLMVVCVEAGTGLDASITRVGEEMRLSNRVLSDEFRLLSLELRAGKPREEALRNLAVRTDSEDVTSLVTLLIQTEKFGTNIAQTLRVYSDSMRTKRYQRAQEVAAKLPVKLVFPMIFFILPSLFVAIVGPAVIRIAKVLFPIFRGFTY